MQTNLDVIFQWLEEDEPQLMSELQDMKAAIIALIRESIPTLADMPDDLTAAQMEGFRTACLIMEARLK